MAIKNEFLASDYNVVDVNLPTPESSITAEQYFQTGKFFGLTPDSSSNANVYVQFGEGAPDFRKALKVFPGDTYEFQDRFTTFFLWVVRSSESSGPINLKFLIGNKEIKFNPSPQVLNQVVRTGVNLEVTDTGTTFDQKISDIVFFETPFTPTNPLAKKERLALKASTRSANTTYIDPDSGNSSEYIKTGKSGLYGKNLRYSSFLASTGLETPSRADRLITPQNYPAGSLLVLVADFIANPTLITVAVKWNRTGNEVTEDRPALLRATVYDPDRTTRQAVIIALDTVTNNDTYKIEGIDSYSPVGQSELNKIAIETLNPSNVNIIQALTSGHMGRSSKSFVFFINDGPDPSPLVNSLDLLTVEVCLSWISAYNDSNGDNARRSQILESLNLRGWIANPQWLQERFGGWYS